MHPTTVLALSIEAWSAIGSIAQAIGTFIAVIVAIVAARYAARQVREARAQVEEVRASRQEQSEQADRQRREQNEREQRLREEQAASEQRLREEESRPFVVVDFESSPASQHLVDLVVSNIGSTVAKNVRITTDPPLESSDETHGYPLSQAVLMREGIPFLPPGKKISAFFDSSIKRYQRKDLPNRYVATVQFEDYAGRPQEPLKFVLDYGVRYDLLYTTVYGTHHAAEALREISEAVRKWSHFGGRGLEVWSHDGDAFRDKRRQDRDRFLGSDQDQSSE